MRLRSAPVFPVHQPAYKNARRVRRSRPSCLPTEDGLSRRETLDASSRQRMISPLVVLLSTFAKIILANVAR
jgi:hypothetical protein